MWFLALRRGLLARIPILTPKTQTKTKTLTQYQLLTPARTRFPVPPSRCYFLGFLYELPSFFFSFRWENFRRQDLRLRSRACCDGRCRLGWSRRHRWSSRGGPVSAARLELVQWTRRGKLSCADVFIPLFAIAAQVFETIYLQFGVINSILYWQ